MHRACARGIVNGGRLRAHHSVTSAEDVLALQRGERLASGLRMPADADQVLALAALGASAEQVDDVALRSGLSPSRAAIALLRLELSGHVQLRAGGRYERLS